MRSKAKIICMVVAITLVGGIIYSLRPDDAGMQIHNASRKGSGPQAAQPAAQAAFDKSAYSLTDPASIWVIANKQHPLQPKAYAPSDLRAPNIPLRLSKDNGEMLLRDGAATAMEAMATAAKKDGSQLMLASGYRSYNFQVSLYNRYVAQQGQVVADTQSARPGYSEHQTGWAADLEPASRKCEIAACFATTTEGKWLAAHAWQYGFIIRYPENGQDTTGYIYEPWHVRYVGTGLAEQLHKEHMPVLEDFFGLGKAPGY